MASVDLTKIGKLVIRSTSPSAPGAFGKKLRNRGFQMNPPYLTTCRCCTNWNHMHHLPLHEPETPKKQTGMAIPQTYKLSLQGITMETRDADTLEMAADQFSSSIITVYEQNCLPLKIKKARETYWWKSKLEKLRKETRERFRRVQKGNMEELWNLSNATRDAYRKAIREAKSKSWTSFCSDKEKGKEADRLNRLLVRNPRAMLSTLRLLDGTYSESDEKTLNLLISPDGIYPILLQRAGYPTIGPLVRIARASLTLGYIPKVWRGTSVFSK